MNSAASIPTLELFAVGMDPLLVRRIQSLTAGTELDVRPASAQDVLELDPSHAARVLVGSQWKTDQDLSSFCYAVRERFHSRSRIVAVAGLPGHRPDFVSGIFGVDDIIQRPFGRDLLRRLREALTLLDGDARSPQLRGELQRALDRRETGELVVRSGAISATIHVEDGHILWANVSTMPTSLAEIVEHAGIAIDPETTRAIIEETQRTGAHFADVLIAWAILEPASGRDALRKFIADRVKLILSLPNAAALFLTRSRKKRDAFRFRRQELFRTHEVTPGASVEPRWPSAIEAIDEPAMHSLIAQLTAIPGVISGALVDRATGDSLAHFGEEFDVDVLWGQYALLTTVGDHADESATRTRALCYVTRVHPTIPSVLLFVVAATSELAEPELRAKLAAVR